MIQWNLQQQTHQEHEEATPNVGFRFTFTLIHAYIMYIKSHNEYSHGIFYFEKTKLTFAVFVFRSQIMPSTIQWWEREWYNGTFSNRHTKWRSQKEATPNVGFSSTSVAKIKWCPADFHWAFCCGHRILQLACGWIQGFYSVFVIYRSTSVWVGMWGPQENLHIYVSLYIISSWTFLWDFHYLVLLLFCS